MKIGDIVTLKSGGLPMTVIEVDPTRSRVSCQWFKDGNRHQDAYHSDALAVLRRDTPQTRTVYEPTEAKISDED